MPRNVFPLRYTDNTRVAVGTRQTLPLSRLVVNHLSHRVIRACIPTQNPIWLKAPFSIGLTYYPKTLTQCNLHFMTVLQLQSAG